MFQKGDPIIYVPPHAEGNIYHPDAEPGFVVSKHPTEDAYYCRFWLKTSGNGLTWALYSPIQLRTRTNSELAPAYLLRPYHQLVSRDFLEKVIAALEEA